VFGPSAAPIGFESVADGVHPHTIILDWIDPLDVIATGLLSSDHGLALVGAGDHGLARWSYLCPQPLVYSQQCLAYGSAPFAQAEQSLKAAGVTHDPDGPPFQGGWAGLLSYGLGHVWEKFDRPAPSDDQAGHPWPDLALGLCDTLAAFDRVGGKVLILSAGLDETGRNPDPDRAKARAMALADRIKAITPRMCGAGNGALEDRFDEAGFGATVARTVAYIRAGDIFQANLSLRRAGRLGQGDTPEALFVRLVRQHPAPFAALLLLPDEGTGARAVVSHAPERFLSMTSAGLLESRPIKGTRKRHTNRLADESAARELLASPKDRAENLMIVDLMRNDLARVSQPGTVWVPRLFGLEAFSTVHHMVSDVHGQLKQGLTAFDALAAAFPPGSITGAPKVRAMEIISELENEPRGPWCGAMVHVGWDGAMDSSVLIRTAACHKATGKEHWSVEVRGGAGIVSDSDPETEVAEMRLKTRALAWAITGQDDV
jgi:para-aminobenzoate synthetase component I